MYRETQDIVISGFPVSRRPRELGGDGCLVSERPGGGFGAGDDMVPAGAFIMPVFNGAHMLARSVGSLQAQIERDWELIIVIDGATDDSAASAAALAAADSRIRVISQARSGPAAARNRGLDAARAPWVAFLDVDDTVEPDYLRRMLARAGAGDADAVVTGYTRLNERGERIGRFPPPDMVADPLACCLAGPPAAIHCFLTRRAILGEVGGFDPELRVGEDWDLWLRLARHGCRFARVEGVLAHYRTEGASLSSDGPLMMRSFRRVLEKARRDGGAWPIEEQEIADHLLATCFWSGGVAIGQGRPPRGLAAEVSPDADWQSDDAHLARRFIEGLVIGSRLGWREMYRHWPGWSVQLDELFRGLGERLGQAFDGWAIRQAIEIDILRAGHLRRACAFETAIGVPITWRLLRRGYAGSMTADVIVFRLPGLRPSPWFTFAAPLLTPLTGGDILRIAARATARRIAAAVEERPALFPAAARMRRLLAVARRAGGFERKRPRRSARPRALAALVAASATAIGESAGIRSIPPPEKPQAMARAYSHPGTGAGVEEWETFFSREDPWDYGNAYEQLKYRRTLDLIVRDAAAPIRHALEIACAEGRFTAMLAPVAGQVTAYDISETALKRAERRNTAHPNIRFAQRDVFREEIDGRYDLITCSEVLYYMADAAALRGLGARIAAALEPGGRFVHAHAYALSDSPGRTAFDWDDGFAGQTIFEAFAATPGLQHRRTIETDLYRIDLFEKSERREVPVIKTLGLDGQLPDAVAASVVWNGAVRRRADVADERVYSLPVLAFPAIMAAPGDRPDALSASSFEQQLRYLRRRGFRSVSLAEWDEGAVRGGSLKGRPIILSFDDPGTDFADTVWPIVRRNGFGALLFVPVGNLIGRAGTDPAIGYEQLVRLADEGVEIASQLVTRRPATLLRAGALLDEALTSRIALERLTGKTVDAVAPPLGLSDSRVEQLLAAAGYTRVFLAEGEQAAVSGQEMRLPRIAVDPDMAPDAFAAAVGTPGEPFNAGDDVPVLPG